MNRSNKKNYLQRPGQATVELFLTLALLMVAVIYGIKLYNMAYEAKTESIGRYNLTLEKTKNMRTNFNYNGIDLSVDITKFKIPKLSFDPGMLVDVGKDLLWNQFGGDLLAKLGLDSTESWLKAGIKGGIDAFVTSDFDYKMIPWGFGLGVVTSGDAKRLFSGFDKVNVEPPPDFVGPVFEPMGFFAGDYMSIVGQGIQGALTGYFSSRGDWGEALAGGLTGVLDSPSFQTKLSNVLGNKNFLVSTATGALSGAITGGNEGMLQGALMGSMRSNFVQKNVSKALGGKDYLINAANISAVGAIQGAGVNAILSGAAVAAFSAASVQKAVFGEDPNKFVQNLGNATVSGTVAAVATKDINQLYYAAGGVVANAIVSKTVETAYGAVRGEENLKKNMKTVKFASALITMGALIAADPQTAMGYGQYVAAQTVQESLIEKFGKKKNDGDKKSDETDEDKEKDKDKEDKEEDVSAHSPKAGAVEKNDPLFLSNKVVAMVEKDLKESSLNADIEKISPQDPSTEKPGILLASADERTVIASYSGKRAYKGKPMTKVKIRTAKAKIQGKSSTEKRGQKMPDLYQAIETVTPEDVLESNAYRRLLKNKDLAKELLRQELKVTIRNINALYLLRQGYLKEDVETILSSRDFERALEKATKDKAIAKQLSSIVDYALSPQNIRQTLASIQQRIIAERAYFVELEIRKLLWNSERQDIIYSKSKRQNIFVEIYRKIGG